MRGAASPQQPSRSDAHGPGATFGGIRDDLSGDVAAVGLETKAEEELAELEGGRRGERREKRSAVARSSRLGRERQEVAEEDLVARGVALDRVQGVAGKPLARPLEPRGADRVARRVLVAVDEHPQAEDELVRGPKSTAVSAAAGGRQALRARFAGGRTHRS